MQSKSLESGPLQDLAISLLDLSSTFDWRTIATAASPLITLVLDMDCRVDGQFEHLGDSSLLLR